MVRAAGPPGICEPELATMTLEVGLGNVAFTWLGEGFWLTHAASEIAAPTTTLDRHLCGAHNGNTRQSCTRLIKEIILRLMIVARECYASESNAARTSLHPVAAGLCGDPLPPNRGVFRRGRCPQHGYAKLARGSANFAAILAAIGIPLPETMAWLTLLVERSMRRSTFHSPSTT